LIRSTAFCHRPDAYPVQRRGTGLYRHHKGRVPFST
jgi:hypothetical protein